MAENNSVLNLKNLDAGYEKKIIVGGVNLNVEEGEILCLIGPNGAGKSTLLKTIVKEIKALGGTISVLGKDEKSLSELNLAKNISMVMTERILPEYMTCREVVESGRYPYTGRLGLLSVEDKQICEDAIKTVGAENIAEKQFCKVSDGQKQRIMFARAIAQSTKIIVLDEPTLFLDMRYKIDLVRIIKSLAKEQKKAVILSMHELELVKLLADKIACVSDGKIVKQGTPKEIFSGNFIQKLYNIKTDEFDQDSGTVKINFETKKAPKTAAHGRPGVIMVQGTMSSAGKSLIVTGLCRIFKQDGWKVAPFKSQNMALNSYVTEDGYEMGRAQVMQAEAAGLKPEVIMNPILLKPTSDRKSQVIVNGEVVGNMEAREYFSYKKSLVPEIMKAFNRLSSENEIIVIEGAGSPAEINLRENDIVNMGLAELVDSPVLLVGDIDRGGVFAQLLGTLELLQPDEKARVKGLIINKFRGDKTLLDSGITELEERAGINVCGVVPFVNLSLDDEDSLSSRFEKKPVLENGINIGVIRLPHISNFSDFSVFEQFDSSSNLNNFVRLHYLDKNDIQKVSLMDMIIIPGSKNTISDLLWLKNTGISDAVELFSKNGGLIFGICGGLQMLGKSVSDPDGVEGAKTECTGLGLLDINTVLESQKIRRQVSIRCEKASGFCEFLNGKTISGYEIHMGQTKLSEASDTAEFSAGYSRSNVYASYIHGFFDNDDIALCILKELAHQKNLNNIETSLESVDFGSRNYNAFKGSQYDLLAATLREHLDMKKIYQIMGLEGPKTGQEC